MDDFKPGDLFVTLVWNLSILNPYCLHKIILFCGFGFTETGVQCQYNTKPTELKYFYYFLKLSFVQTLYSTFNINFYSKLKTNFLNLS